MRHRLLVGFFFCLLVASMASVHAGGSLETFTLPGPGGDGGMQYSDVQAAFPAVDWQTLDRLYLPAAHYSYIRLGNLPQRSADRPLILTNAGGQVRVGGLGFANYNFRILGGSNWILTGRYDVPAATGHADFRGHEAGYAQSRDQYGILIDDVFEDGNSGLSITSSASDFEISFVEIRHVGFAGMLFKTDNSGDANMENVVIHDNYVHDTGSEGIYIGSTQPLPQHKITGLRFFNNRVVRTDTEALQLGQLGGDSEVYNNVLLHGAIGWKNPFAGFQDKNTQIGAREGNVWIHHNIFIGGAGNFFILFDQTAPGDVHTSDHLVRFEENFFSHCRGVGAYFHSMTDGQTRFRFANNTFSEIDFHYDEFIPTAVDHNTVFRIFNTVNPIEISDNRWSGPQMLFQTPGSNVTAFGNVNEAIEPLEFAASGFVANFDHFRMEIWGLQTPAPNNLPILYEQGDFVMYLGGLYENIEPGIHTGKQPDLHPGTWRSRPLPPDDLRLAPNSPYVGIGLLDTLDTVFADGVESGDLSAWTP